MRAKRHGGGLLRWIELDEPATPDGYPFTLPSFLADPARHLRRLLG